MWMKSKAQWVLYMVSNVSNLKLLMQQVSKEDDGIMSRQLDLRQNDEANESMDV